MLLTFLSLDKLTQRFLGQDISSDINYHMFDL